MENGQRVHWDAEGYDKSMGFVSRYGQDAMSWLDPKPGDRILDFGCGTGDLAARIAAEGADVEGVDISPEMIERARTKYPELVFHCADAKTWRPAERFDAVFSNAALHWMKDAEGAARAMAECLKPGGRLAAEFGGRGNVKCAIKAMNQTLKRHGREDAGVMPWYFPSVGEYASLLESVGFEVRNAMLFERPTRLDGEDGMLRWLEMFGGALIPGATQGEKTEWFAESAELLKRKYYHEGAWIIEYRRLLVHAVKVDGLS